MSRVKVTETFVSIQGEADAVGWPTLFVRLDGCPLRCVYCDTQYAFYGGEWRTVDELLEVARGSGVRHVCVTGGEPLAQRAGLDLLVALGTNLTDAPSLLQRLESMYEERSSVLKDVEGFTA